MEEEVKVDESTIAEETTDEVKLTKAEYEELIGAKATVGSLKRELKDLRKPKEEHTEKSSTEEFGLLQKTYLRSAGIVDEDEVALAKKIKKEIGVEWDTLPDNKYFKMELDSLRTDKANAQATDVRGGGAQGSGAKNAPEHWIAKGIPPTVKDVPDRKERVKIINAMVKNEKNGGGGKFYNE